MVVRAGALTGLMNQPTAQVIDGSLKFDDDFNTNLSRSVSTAGNRRTWTFSCWLKKSKLYADSTYQNIFSSLNTGTIQFDTIDQLRIYDGGGGATREANSVRMRDTNGWYHIVVKFDTTQATDTNRVFIYLNGEDISKKTGSWPSQNYQSPFNAAQTHYLGTSSDSNNYLPGLLSQVYLIDGQALGPEYFGFTDPLTNTWKPKKFIPQATPNKGVTWSSGAGSNFESARPASNGFNGDPETFTRTDNASVTATVTLPSSVPFTTLQVRGARDSGNGTITINGTDVSSQFTSSSSTLETVTITGVTSPLTSIALTGISGSAQPRFSQIIVDGVTLIDGDTANIGTNGFYLPMDGNSPIGEDKSGNGNDWTPVNFGGSVALDNTLVSGARPILNTTQGGTQAGVGVFGSKENIGYAVTVFNDGGGNKYYIDGVQAPTLSNLVRGATYTFDQSDSSNSSHPLVFGSTAEGNNFARGALYGSISAGTAGAATTITIPYDAPETLYYHCSAHSGMGGSIVGINTDETKADQYASNCTLAVPLVGGANDVSASIACTMTNKAATVSGAAADSSESNFYNGSFVFDGSNDQLSYPAGSDFDFGGGDFTLETWLNMDTIGAGQAILEYSGQSSSSAPDGQWYFSTSNGWHWFHNSSAYAIIPKARVPVDKWIHMALVREGNVITHYLNGVCEASSSYTRTDAGSSSRALIIGQQNSSSYFDGHLQDYRIYKGVAKYSGTTVGTQYFVPPSISPDILPDTPSGVSGSSKLAKITDGAVSFDGTGDSLVCADSDDFNLGSGDFTIEAYVYGKSFGSFEGIIGQWPNNGGNTNNSFVLEAVSGDLEFYYSVGSTLYGPIQGGTLATNKWQHVAAVRNGNTMYIFIDGVMYGNGQSVTHTFNNPTSNVTIGGEINSSGYWDGFISNLRLIKGTALYTKNFTPPTAPLTDVTNTKLLCCQSNAQAGAAAVSPNISGTNDGTVWSSFFSLDSASYYWANNQTPGRAFNGNVNNSAISEGNGSSFTWTPVPALSVSSSFEIYRGTDTTSNTVQYKLNDGSWETFPKSSWTEIATSGSITKLEIRSSAANPALSAVRLDSTILLDPVEPLNDSIATNFNPFNTDINTVRGQETGYCTWNPLAVQQSGHGGFRDGNLEIIADTAGSHKATLATFAIPSTGKWYWEVKAYRTGGTNNGGGAVGVAERSALAKAAASGTRLGETNSSSWVLGLTSFDALHAGNSDYADYLNGGTVENDTKIIGIAVDMDNDKMWMHYSGVYGNAGGVGNPVTGANPAFSGEFSGLEIFPAAGVTVDSGSGFLRANWGQKPFSFPPPEGYQPLNAANTRPETVITRPDHYVDAVAYTSNSGSAYQVSGLNFSPDLILTKNRDNSSGDWNLQDTVCGITSVLTPNYNYVASTQTDNINAVTADGFTVGTGSRFNSGTQKIISWAWKAGGPKFGGHDKEQFWKDGKQYSSAAAVGLTGGTITPTACSIGSRQNFNIIRYTGNATTGATLPHGLGKVPTLIIAKRTGGGVADWLVGHKSLATNWGKVLYLNQGQGEYDQSEPFNDTAPTSTLITMSDSSSNNGNNGRYVMYLWADTPGLFKTGKYVNNALDDGPYIECGFKPALVLLKCLVSGSTSWRLADIRRDPFNDGSGTKWLKTNSSNGDADERPIDFLSTGFKIRKAAGGDINQNSNAGGVNYIFAAWAEAPSIDLYGGGANAR